MPDATIDLRQPIGRTLVADNKSSVMRCRHLCCVGVVVTFARMQAPAPLREVIARRRRVARGAEAAPSLEASIRFEGALDALTISDVRPMIDAVIAENPPKVTVDLDAVTRLDSTGVGAIVSLFRRVKANGGEVVVVHAHDQPLMVLKLLKLDAVFGM